MAELETLGIVRETTGRRYGRHFVYGAQLDLLDRGLGTTGVEPTDAAGASPGS